MPEKIVGNALRKFLSFRNFQAVTGVMYEIVVGVNGMITLGTRS